MTHKVTIELEFEPTSGESDEQQTVFDSDVYDYLEQLIKDGSLDYKVTAASGYTYGKIEHEEEREEKNLSRGFRT
tara:strand:+ start:314 stop:538 length:225 start_codon:yes stop_codon:yes gene_type:complete